MAPRFPQWCPVVRTTNFEIGGGCQQFLYKSRPILLVAGSVDMRAWIVACALTAVVAGAAVGSLFDFVKVTPKAGPPVATVQLFSAPTASPTDLIAAKLAIQPGFPNVQEKRPAPPKKQQAKTKDKSKVKSKPKKPVAVAGSL
jgi:hypothetical protein